MCSGTNRLTQGEARGPYGPRPHPPSQRERAGEAPRRAGARAPDGSGRDLSTATGAGGMRGYKGPHVHSYLDAALARLAAPAHTPPVVQWQSDRELLAWRAWRLAI